MFQTMRLNGGTMTPVSYSRVSLKDGFWKEVVRKNALVSLKNVYRRFAETGRFEAVRCVKKENPPHIFFDSDVAKWLEAAAYLQKDYPDTEVRTIIDDTVREIVKNQLPCGYFNSYYQVYKPDRIFMERTEHELYCAGHLIEAAVALDMCDVNHDLLPAMSKYADYIYDRFYVKRDTGFTTCGHPEIELALVRLYEHTGEKKYLKLAKFFLDERGTRAEDIYPWMDRDYDQSHKPVREQREAVGHSVRALYLYIAMADVGRLTDDEELVSVCRALFDDIVRSKLYITAEPVRDGTASALQFLTICPIRRHTPRPVRQLRLHSSVSGLQKRATAPHIMLSWNVLFITIFLQANLWTERVFIT